MLRKCGVAITGGDLIGLLSTGGQMADFIPQAGARPLVGLVLLALPISEFH